MYGRAVPIRPAPREIHPPHCLRGHDLAVATYTSNYHHLYNLTVIGCNICWELEDPRWNWGLVDPARQHTDADAPTSGLVLVRIPPANPRGGIGQLQLRIDAVALADLDLAVCGPCRRGPRRCPRRRGITAGVASAGSWWRPRLNSRRPRSTAGQPPRSTTT